MPNVTEQDYLNNVRATAEEVLDNLGYGRDNGYDVSDLAHEYVDNDQWIIYYALNDAVLRYASNPDAWEDCYCASDIGDLVIDRGMKGARTVQAYFAMLEDVNHAIYMLADERGIDLYS